MKIVGCLLETHGKFIILKRPNYKPNGGTWGLPAGKVEKDEAPDEAMLRELREETGYSAAPEHLEHIGDYFFGDPGNSYEFIFYRIKTQDTPAIQLEANSHEAYRWVTAQECFDEPRLIADLHDLLKITKLVR